MFPRWIQWVALAAALTGLAAGLQWMAGSYTTELSGYPDEPAHLVTGMLVRDYVVQGMGAGPVDFAENYYLHYPKVGFGMWPPLFHFVEGGWFLIVPPSKTSAFLLQALIIGILAGMLAWSAAGLFGAVTGVAAGVALICLPQVQYFTAMIMADNLMAAVAFAAMLAFSAYARTGRRSWAVGFGVLLGLAVVTKSNAASLGLLPIVAMLLMRRYKGMFAWNMFLAAGTSLAIAVPWQLLVMRYWTGTVSFKVYSWNLAVELLQQHLQIYATMPGTLLVVLAGIGLWQRVVLPYVRASVEPLWAASAGLVVSLFLGGLAPLPPEPRYHVASVAALLLFAAAGVHRIASALPGGVISLERGRVVVTLAVAAWFALTTFTIPLRAQYGYVEAGSALLANPAYRDSVMLISSENYGEGMFIPEIALNEPRPGHYVLRATKVLSRSRWDMDAYELLHRDMEEMQKYLESIPVHLVVLDTTKGAVEVPHHRMLKRLLESDPSKWMQVGMYPAAGPNAAGGRILVYQLRNAPATRGRIEVDMRYTLHRMLSEGNEP